MHTESAAAVNSGTMVYWGDCAGEKNKFSKVDAGDLEAVAVGEAGQSI